MQKIFLTLVVLLSLGFNFLCSQDNNLIWTKTHKLSNAPNVLKITNDDKYMILGYLNNIQPLSFFDINKNEFVENANLPLYNRITALAINAKNELVGIGYLSGVKKHFSFDLNTFTETKSTLFDATYKSFTVFSASPAGKYFYSYLGDSTLIIWSTETQIITEKFYKKDGNFPKLLYFSNDDSKAVYYKDGSINVINYPTKDVISSFTYSVTQAPYSLRLTDDNKIIIADKNELTFKKYDFQGNLLSTVPAQTTLDNYEVSTDAQSVLQISTGLGVIYNNFSAGKTFLYKAVSPSNIAKVKYLAKESLIISNPSHIKLITIADTSSKLRIDLNNFVECRYLDKDNLSCLQSVGNIINIDAHTGLGSGKPQHEKSNLKFVTGNNKKATENYVQKSIRIYDLNNIEGKIDSLRTSYNIANFTFSGDMNYLHVAGSSSNYVYDYNTKQILWDKDSANVTWSSWKDYLITNTVIDTANSKLNIRRTPTGAKHLEITKPKNAKYLITRFDNYIYVENKGSGTIESLGWIRYSLDNPGTKENINFNDTLFGTRSKSVLIRRDNHIFTYSILKPEFWIRDISDGKLIYYNKCQRSGTIVSVAFSDDSQQFTLVFADGSLSSYQLPDGILGIDEENSVSAQISIFPNPASDYIEISLSPAGGGRGWTLSNGVISSEAKNLVRIYNALGIEFTPPQTPPLEGMGLKIDISNLTPGVYFIKIGDKFEKFIKL
jgi:hypothetical protein